MSIFDYEYDLSRVSPEIKYILEETSDLAISMRDLLERSWTGYKHVAEQNFLSSLFTESFQQRWWEMYLWNLLSKRGCKLKQPGKKKPDIHLTARFRDIFIECISPTKGAGANKIPEYKAVGVTAHKVPSEQIMLRLTAAIREKVGQYHEQKLQQYGFHHIVAMDYSQLVFSGFDEDYLFSVVYPFGKPVVTFDFNEGEPSEIFGYSYSDHLITNAGSSVKTDSFMSSGPFNCVSAILYVNANFANIARFGDPKLILVHNYKAAMALSRKIFKSDKQFIFNGYNRLNVYKNRT